MFHYRAQNAREAHDYAAQLLAYRRGDPDWIAAQRKNKEKKPDRMKIFERITKRPALLNYYLRRSFYWPDTLPEVLDYWQQHNELPFLYGGDNWPYDAMCERQRRKGVYASQYLTPDRTARQMAALAVRYFDNDSRVVDACCGTGQLTRALILEGVHPSAILGFDTDATG